MLVVTVPVRNGVHEPQKIFLISITISPWQSSKRFGMRWLQHTDKNDSLQWFRGCHHLTCIRGPASCSCLWWYCSSSIRLFCSSFYSLLVIRCVSVVVLARRNALKSDKHQTLLMGDTLCNTLSISLTAKKINAAEFSTHHSQKLVGFYGNNHGKPSEKLLFVHERKKQTKMSVGKIRGRVSARCAGCQTDRPRLRS
jgi:hypothetical protein